jgi:uncharacterized phiE125 gp8 family phage protein
MRIQLVTPATLEPITVSELKLHLRVDSGSFADNVDETQSIAPGAYDITYELMTLDVAPGGAGWAVGDTITGQTSNKTCVIVTIITTKTYIVKSRSGAYTLGEILTNGVATADQGAAYPTFTTGYRILGDSVDVLGYTSLVVLQSGVNAATGTVDVKIQESDDNSTWNDWSTGAFTQVTTANDNATQEKAYTGTKRYIRTAAQVLLATCSFGTTIVRLTASVVEDDLLNAIITASREHIEDITSRALLTQTWDYYLDDFPCENYIKIPFGNLQSVPATQYIKYTDSAGTVTTMTSGTDYIWETNGEQCGRVVLPYDTDWPSFTAYPSNPIVIRFVCGWTTAALVPYKIKAACKLIAGDLYANRESQILSVNNYQINKTAQRLLFSTHLWDEF